VLSASRRSKEVNPMAGSTKKTRKAGGKKGTKKAKRK
jgi:hypothetical protein